MYVTFCKGREINKFQEVSRNYFAEHSTYRWCEKGRRGPRGNLTVFTTARSVINSVIAANIRVKKFSCV